MRRWILSLILATWSGVAGAFPVHVNTGTFDISAAGSASWNAFTWKWSNRDVQQFENFFTSSAGDTFSDITNIQFRLSYPEAGPFYLTIANGVVGGNEGNASFCLPGDLPTTNIPPPRRYYAEFIAYSANQTTRSLAKGTVEVSWSLFYNTNSAPWVPVVVTFSATSAVTVVECDPVHVAWLPTYTSNRTDQTAALVIASNALHAATTAEVATARAAELSLSTGKVDRVDTNGWTVSTHESWITNEALWGAASNSVVYTNDPAMTNARAPTAHDQAWSTITDAPAFLTNVDLTAYATTNLLDAHTTNTVPHVSTGDRSTWNDVTNKATLADVAGVGYLTNVDLTAYATTSNLEAHTTNTVPHVSAGDRTNWDGKTTLTDVAGMGYLTNGGYIVEQSYSIVSNSVDTGILIVSDYSNGNATAFGTYVGTTTNANGWYYKFSFGLKSLRNTNDAGYYQLTGLPPTWSTPPLISDEGTGGSATGRVYVDYFRTSTTNLLADASGLYGDGAGITNVTDAVARAAELSLSTGKVDRVDTNGWVVSSHAGLATGTPVYAESDPVFKAWTNGGYSGVWHPGDSVTNAVDEVARANNTLTSNAIPTTASQVGAVPTNDTRYLASLTNAAAFDVAGAAAGVQNSLSVHSTNGMAHLTLFGETITNVSINGVDGTRSNRSVHLTYSEPPDTNFLEKIGGTVSGPIYTTSSTAQAGGNPQQSELTTAGWIRQLISASGQAFYATTNLMPAAWSPTNFGFSSVTQAVAFSRVYVAPTNSQYIGWVTTTNLQSYLGGNTITINAYLSRQGGGGGPTVTLHPEIYFSYSTNTALANLTGDFIAEPRAIATGTNLYQWVVPIPPQTFTAAVYILRTFKIDAITGSTRPNVAFVGGGSTPSHILVAGLSAGQGYVYEAPVDGGIYGRKNQSWVGAVGTNDTRYLAGLTNESRYWQNAAIIPLATNRYSVTLGGSAVQVGDVYWLLTNSASWRGATGTLTVATTDGSYLEDVISSNSIAQNLTSTPGTTIGGFVGGGSRLDNTQILFTAWCQDGGVGPYYAAMSNIVPRTFDRSMTPWQYTNDTPSIVSRVDDSTAADQRAVVNQKTMAAYVAAQAPAISAAGWDYTPSGAKRPTRGVAVIDLPLVQQGVLTYLQAGDSYCQSAVGGDYISVSTGSVWRIGPSGRVAFEIASTNKLLTVTAFSVVTNQARFTISTNGVTGGSVVVEYCADLATPLWLSVADLVTTNRTTNWTATCTATGTRGFYRAVSVGGDNRITSYYPHYFPAGVSGITAAQVGAVTLNSSYTNLMGLTARMYPSEASLVIDAMKQNEVLVTLTNDTIVSLPTNALVDGRTIKWRFYADGDRTVTWTAPDFKIPSSSTMSNVVTVSNGTYSIFVTEYAAPTTNWLVQAYIWGY